MPNTAYAGQALSAVHRLILSVFGLHFLIYIQYFAFGSLADRASASALPRLTFVDLLRLAFKLRDCVAFEAALDLLGGADDELISALSL